MTDLTPKEEKLLEPFNRLYVQGKCLSSEQGTVSAVLAENNRCVQLLEAKAEEAKRLGMDNISSTYITAAELIRIR